MRDERGGGRAKKKVVRTTDRELLDQLIDWYDRFKPDSGKVILVKLSKDKLKQFAMATPNPDEFFYRGRTLRIAE